MGTIGVVTDSHCGIPLEEAEKLGVFVLPMPFFFSGECCLEGVSLTRERFFERMSCGEAVTTSQQSPEAVMELWRSALQRHEKILYFPLSSGLSGACSTAKMLAEEDAFRGRVFVVDNGRLATPMHRSILDALELIEEGFSAEEIRRILEAAGPRMSIYIAVETLEYLKRGGRISAAAAAVGSLMGVKPILRLHTGLLESFKKIRGMRKARQEMIASMKHDLETVFREDWERGTVTLMAATSADEATTRNWVEEIRENFPGMEVLCDPLSLGVCCHTGPGALGIGCSCRPAR